MSLTVAGLIENLQKYPQNSPIGFYPKNAHARGCAWRVNKIQSIELCNDEKTVALVGDFA